MMQHALIASFASIALSFSTAIYASDTSNPSPITRTKSSTVETGIQNRHRIEDGFHDQPGIANTNKEPDSMEEQHDTVEFRSHITSASEKTTVSQPDSKPAVWRSRIITANVYHDKHE